MVYLRDLVQGLVQDAPQTPEGGAEGAHRLQQQAEEAEAEYDNVSDKVRREGPERRHNISAGSLDAGGNLQDSRAEGGPAAVRKTKQVVDADVNTLPERDGHNSPFSLHT